MAIYLMKTNGYKPSVGLVSTFFGTRDCYDSDGNFYEPVLKTAGNYERYIFSRGTTQGRSVSGKGEVVVHNESGQFDEMRKWGFAGRKFTIEEMPHPGGTITLRFTGTLEQAAVSETELIFRILDSLEDLNKPVQNNLYKGTTTYGGLNEAEGRPDDLKDKPKPLLFGKVFNMPAVPANVFDLIYQVHDGEIYSVDAVYDKGYPLTNSNTDYPTIAALRTAYISPGTYATCKALGLFRLGASPAGQITADVTQDNLGKTAAQIAYKLLIKGGIPSERIDLDSFNDLDAKNSSEVGVFFDSERTTLECITDALESIGGYIIPDRNGVFKVGRFELPKTEYVLDIQEYDLHGGVNGVLPIIPSDQGNGVPTYKVTLEYKKNWQVQSESETLEEECVTDEMRAFAAIEFREVVAQDDDVLELYPLSPPIRFTTYLTQESDALDEANRRLEIYSTFREIFEITVSLRLVNNLELGDTVRFTYPRFDLQDGKNFVVLGIVEDYFTETALLSLWG